MKFPFHRTLYAAVHTPQPHQQSFILRVIPETPHVVKLYKEYRDQQGYLSKREIETLGIWPPCGARVRLVPFQITPYPFDEILNEEEAAQLK